MIDFVRDGASLRLAVDGVEARILTDLAGQLDGMLAARESLPAPPEGRTTPDDPALARLLPDAIRDDPGAARELRALTEPSLLGRKRASLRAVAASIAEPGALDAETELAWLQSLTDLRLTIAARLGIEHEPRRPDADGPSQPLLDVFDWLGGVQDRLLAVIEERDAIETSHG